MDLAALIADTRVSLDKITQLLESGSYAERVQAVLALNHVQQRTLYRKAAIAAPVTLADFVPQGTPALQEIRHYGRNTLPLPRKFQFFEKRFCRPTDGSERLFGYNEWPPLTRILGPGYFVALKTAGNAAWEQRGAIVVDYFQVPDREVTPGWPKLVNNSQGLQRLVFHRTRDFMRRVSAQVTIGAAYRAEKELDYYFVLVRGE